MAKKTKTLPTGKCWPAGAPRVAYDVNDHGLKDPGRNDEPRTPPVRTSNAKVTYLAPRKSKSK
jgi:hypothetical protein